MTTLSKLQETASDIFSYQKSAMIDFDRSGSVSDKQFFTKALKSLGYKETVEISEESDRTFIWIGDDYCITKIEDKWVVGYGGIVDLELAVSKSKFNTVGEIIVTDTRLNAVYALNRFLSTRNVDKFADMIETIVYGNY